MVFPSTEISLTWRDWQYMCEQGTDEEGNPVDFEKLGESDTCEDTVHLHDAEVAAEQIQTVEGGELIPPGGFDGDDPNKEDEEDDDDRVKDPGALVDEDAAGSAQNTDGALTNTEGTGTADTKDAEENKAPGEVLEVESYDQLTVAQIREQLTLRGLEYPARAVKADLVALLDADDARAEAAERDAAAQNAADAVKESDTADSTDKEADE
jgi:hypothetical protein